MNLPEFSVFVKPWGAMPLAQLAGKIKRLGFDGIELPVRPGFPVRPDNVLATLPEAVRIFSGEGLKIHSIAADMTEPVFQAAAAAGVPLIRICVPVPAGGNYLDAEADTKREFSALVPLLAKHGVTVGVQNHCDRWVSHSMGLLRLIEDFSPEHFAAVWDAAHNALNGEDPDLGLDIVWSRLRMVNLKNAFRQRVSPPEAEVAAWKIYWTSGRQGQASWPQVARELAWRGYQGPVCLTAEYSDESSVDRLIAGDICFAKEIFSREYFPADAGKLRIKN
ncbi:MAG: sugar phosphate isomerase/epimerase [Opitutaceae bacterium]|nr:sugar phosphate isomerase/epimerase [Opitutaceae bacterium]